MIKLETKLSVASMPVCLHLQDHIALTSGRVFHSYITKRPQKDKSVCVCALLDFELLLLLNQNLFSPCVFIFFFLFSFSR